MKRILVVDDNLMMRKLIINLFIHNSFEFDEAGEGREALEKMSLQQYDLVITDIIMPEMEGIEMIREVKQKHPQTKIIAISGGQPYYLYMAKKLGIQGAYSKPLNQHDFTKAVSQILQPPVSLIHAS